MTDELWHRFVFHVDEDRFIGTILAIISPVISSMTARLHKHFQLKRKERRDLATDQLLFSKVFNYVTSVLNVQQAELYLRPDQQTGLMMAHTKEVPSFVVGADLLQGRPEKELAFGNGFMCTNFHHLSSLTWSWRPGYRKYSVVNASSKTFRQAAITS